MPNYLKHHAHRKRIVANNPLYASTKWRKYRAALLMRRGGQCEACGTVPMFDRELHVDHIRPIAEGGEVYNEANLQILCIQCHGKKTAGERGWGPISNASADYSTDENASFLRGKQDTPRAETRINTGFLENPIF
jgi:5-methylcytosine-specific restriction endonuclease McrA